MSFINGGDEYLPRAIQRRSWNWLIEPQPTQPPVVNTNYVALRNTGPVTYKYSADGITWTSGSFPVGYIGVCVAQNPNGYIVFPSNGTQTYVSVDGATWTAGGMMPALGTWAFAVWNGSFWLASGYDFNYLPLLAKSNDGLTWSSAGIVPPIDPIRILWDGSRFVGACNVPPFIFTSPDGNIWTGVVTNIPAEGNTSELAFYEGRYYTGAFYFSGGYVSCLSSDDLSNWTIELGAFNITPQNFATDGSVLVTPNFQSQRIYSKFNGAWSVVSVVNPGPGPIEGRVVYKNGQFVLIANSGAVYTSPDGQTWTFRSYTPAEASGWWAIR